MGLINGSLQIGRSALLAHQAAMQVIGNNVANAGDPNYTRQTARLTPISGIKLPDGSDPGAGVQLSGIERHIDSALEQRLRAAISNLSYDEITTQVFSRLEALYNEMTDSDLSSSLNEFFNAWSELQTKPHDMSTRAVVVQVGQALADQIKVLRRDVIDVYNDFGKNLTEMVDQINYLAGRVAQLNVEITRASVAGKTPSAMLDQRDAVLKELAELADVKVVEQAGGDVTVYIGSDPLVQYNNARELEITHEGNGELLVPQVVFTDTEAQARISGGKAGAITYFIDDFVTNNLGQLDELASALIFEVNKLHSSGQGLRGYGSITSAYAVSDATVALDQSGLTNLPQNGAFIITVRDANSGQDSVYQINVDLNGLGTDTTLNDLVAQIDAIPTLRAQVLQDGRLNIETTSDSYTFTFKDDDSYALAALGINSFFTGTSAGSIEVNSELVEDPALIAAAQDNTPGDGTNAGRIAQLRTEPAVSLTDQSITDYYRSIVGELGSISASARQNFQVHSAVVDTLKAQRETISGVSLDEEAVALMASQRAFQGSARFVTVVNELMQEILRLL